MAVAAQVFVTKNALIAKPSAARPEPALKPNQPNQSKEAPRITNGTLCASTPLPIFLLFSSYLCLCLLGPGINRT